MQFIPTFASWTNGDSIFTDTVTDSLQDDYGPKGDYIQRGFHRPEVIQHFLMWKNGEFELEAKTTATPEMGP
jgi:hypothetical protein